YVRTRGLVAFLRAGSTLEAVVPPGVVHTARIASCLPWFCSKTQGPGGGFPGIHDMNAHDHYRTGKLREAVKAALEDVKSHPTNSGMRTFLCELLCFTGDLERAERQLDALGEQDPDVMIAISVFRQLIRAEQA